MAAICTWKTLLLLAMVLSLAPQQLLQPQVGAESPEWGGGDAQTPTSGTSQAVALPVSLANWMIGCY